MDNFDPLNFFEAPEIKEKESIHVSPFQRLYATISDEARDEDEDCSIHILDLPSLTEHLPRVALVTILKQLGPGQETNFGTQTFAVSEIKVDEDSLQQTQRWLIQNGYIKLSRNLTNLRFTPEIFSYMRKILSSSHFHEDEEIVQLVSLRISENSGRTARPNFQRRITIKDFGKDILLNEPALTSDSLGLKTWGSSLILSEYIVRNKGIMLREPILELGAGTGLVGIVISLLGYAVTLTDLPEILTNLVKNRDLNHADADCAVLDWTNPSSFLEAKGNKKFNTIVIADPIYSPDHPIWIVNMIKLFLNKDKDARVLLEIPLREKFEQDRGKLWKLLETDFKIVSEDISSGFDDFGVQKFIFKEIRWIL